MIRRIPPAGCPLALLCVLATLFALILAAPNARAQADATAAARFNRRGIYLGVGYRNDAIGGALDGNSMLVGSDIVALVPKLSPGGGLEYSLDVLATHGGLALTYARGEHDAQWLGATGKARCADLDFDFRISFFSRSPIQPHVVGGLGFMQLKVKDAAATYQGVDEAVYRGISWDVGFGASVTLLPRVLLDLSAVHESRSYNTIASGKGSTITIEDGLDGSGWSMRGELLYRLGSL
jgi:opacity protein-like surface antigen